MQPVLLALIAFLAGLCLSAPPARAQDLPFRLPPGFRIEVFAGGLGSPRFMAVDPAGTLLVSIPGQGRVVALPDRDGDGRADAVVTVVDRQHPP
ncbi:MAG: sorbosone dehydrogenase, partial [candidate division NC10 bacterium]